MVDLVQHDLALRQSIIAQLAVAGIPITGILGQEDGSIRVLYGAEATSDQIAQGDAIAATVPLQQAKVAATTAVDAKTTALLAAGFAYTTADAIVNHFDLSDGIRADWAQMANIAAMLTYPFAVGTVDNKSVALVSVADVQDFFAVGLQRYLAIRQGGIDLKARIAAATSIAAVNAITDDRT